ncbi:MAG: PepSY domain-containing protein, partial [Alphaproteobacteria bacterium]|nr:PepSY domain-containing protein [Alphaproteobacteria bacterium]
QAFGLVNQLILLLACIAIILMAVSAMTMWWKRRPTGSLGAPTVPSDWRIPRAVLACIIVAGVFFPLVGLSILAVVLIELALWAKADRKTG